MMKYWIENPPPLDAWIIVERPGSPAFKRQILRRCDMSPCWNVFGVFWDFAGINGKGEIEGQER